MKYASKDRRSQRRIAAAVPVRIRGLYAAGEAFEEATQASNVSRRGFCFLTRQVIRLHSMFTVVFPGLGPSRDGRKAADFFARAIAVSIRKHGKAHRIGMRLIGATLTIYSSENS